MLLAWLEVALSPCGFQSRTLLQDSQPVLSPPPGDRSVGGSEEGLWGLLTGSANGLQHPFQDTVGCAPSPTPTPPTFHCASTWCPSRGTSSAVEDLTHTPAGAGGAHLLSWLPARAARSKRPSSSGCCFVICTMRLWKDTPYCMSGLGSGASGESCGCCDKSPRTPWLKTTETFSLNGPGGQKSEFRVTGLSQGVSGAGLPEAPGEDPARPPPASGGCWQSLACSHIAPVSVFITLWPSSLSSSIFLCSPLVGHV